jgi:hypothetical protein
MHSLLVRVVLCEGKLAVPVSRREKYSHNAGMAFAHHHGGGLAGVHGRSWPHPAVPGKRPVCRGKAPGGPRSAPFGAAMSSSAFVMTGASTATTGARP